MGKRYKVIPLKHLAIAIVKMLLNKFDCVIVVEGNRGLGKSTLTWKIAKEVRRMMRIIINATGGENSPYKNYYEFKPLMQMKHPERYRFIEYKRDGILNFFDKWHTTCIADEMVTSAFNRDFWNEDQKNLIKVMNMYRDRCNLFMMCIPQFQVLDNQIKNLTKIRISVIKRGLAVVQSPNQTIHSRDKWDASVNEKIEREWLMEGRKPRYTRLTTFRGFIKFSPLSEKEQDIYDTIKNYERNVMKKTIGIDDKKPEELDWFDKLYTRLSGGGVKNMEYIKAMAEAHEMSESGLKSKLKRRFEKEGKNPILSSYFYDKKARKEDEIVENKEQMMSEIKNLL